MTDQSTVSKAGLPVFTCGHTHRDMYQDMRLGLAWDRLHPQCPYFDLIAHKTSQWRDSPLTVSVLDAENLSGVKACYSEINSTSCVFKMKLKELDMCSTVRWPALEHSQICHFYPEVPGELHPRAASTP